MTPCRMGREKEKEKKTVSRNALRRRRERLPNGRFRSSPSLAGEEKRRRGGRGRSRAGHHRALPPNSSERQQRARRRSQHVIRREEKRRKEKRKKKGRRTRSIRLLFLRRSIATLTFRESPAARLLEGGRKKWGEAADSSALNRRYRTLCSWGREGGRRRGRKKKELESVRSILSFTASA